jgi:hypothetical protein
VSAVPALKITDPVWLRAQIGLSARRFGCAPVDVLGTIWWYSVSSVLVAPTLTALAAKKPPPDPALTAITLDLLEDGRVADARSSRLLDGDPGKALAAALTPAITNIASVSGARTPALRAIATDSIANRLLWAGAPELAEPLIAGMDERMPRPRFAEVGPNTVVRRASCCLIYLAALPKCVSCPRQRPEERQRRLRAALG